MRGAKSMRVFSWLSDWASTLGIPVWVIIVGGVVIAIVLFNLVGGCPR